MDALAQRAERAMHAELGRSFGAIVRPVKDLQDLLATDPFAEFDLPPAAKRVVTFVRNAEGLNLTLPIEQEGARILKLVGAEVFTAYLPHPKGPVFMNLLERTCGKDITTRTLDTVKKCASA